MRVEQRFWMRLFHSVLDEGIGMVGCLILTPFGARSEWNVEESGSIACAGRYGDGQEEEGRESGGLAHNTVDASYYASGMGSDEARHGCPSGAKVHRCTYTSLPPLVPCW